MRARSSIWLADALVAAAELGPLDDDARTRVFEMLCINPPLTTTAAVPRGGPRESSTESAREPSEASRPSRIPLPVSDAPLPGPPVRVPDAKRAPHRTRTVLKTAESTKPALPGWLSGSGEALAAGGTSSRTPIAGEGLFPRQTERALLATALATMVEGSELDLLRITEMCANLQPLDRVPRLPTPTLRCGLDVMVDLGRGLDPFRADVERLLRSLGDLFFSNSLRVGYFSGCPLREGGDPSPDRMVDDWTPSLRGRPVLAVTDLGIGGPLIDDERAQASEWLRFAERVRHAGQSLYALVPYEAQRWPPSLSKAFTILHWSERTSVGVVQRAVQARR